MKHSTLRGLLRILVGLGLATVFLWKWGCVLDVPDLQGWSCLSDQDCLSPLVCKDRICRKPCFNDLDCLAGSSCTNKFCQSEQTNDGGDPDLFCVPRPGGEICNGKDDNCNNQIDEGGVCKKEGQICEFGSTGTQSCGPGLKCAALSLYPDRPRLCLRVCSLSDLSSCPDKFLCLRSSANIKAICMQIKCTQDSDCVYKSSQIVGFSCVRIGGSNRLCLPAFSKTGTSKAGERCSPMEDLWCAAHLSCTRQVSQADGICTVRCSSDTDCPKELTGATCQSLDNIKVCWKKCSSAADCSQGLQCKNGKCEPNK